MTIFRQIVPNSNQNAINERYEYLISWLSTAGGIRSWLFSHTEGDESEDYENIIIEGLNDIRNVPSEQRKEVEVNTVSLSSAQFDYVKSLMATNKAYVITKQGKQVPIAIKGRTAVRDNKNKEFEVRIKFQFKEENILNV